MRAILDETVHADRRGLYYVVGVTVLVADVAATEGGYLLGTTTRWFDALRGGGVIGERVYISPRIA